MLKPMDPSLEIRKLPILVNAELCRILDLQESWKKLMAIIPKFLYENSYQCDIDADNSAKYRTEHFWLIEKHAEKTGKTCAEILLREWGTSGRVRPALGHLKYLLEKADLFRAADFVTINIMRQEPPLRPSKGPSARVTFKSDELKDTGSGQLEKFLDHMNYPSSAIEQITKINSINTNINYSTLDKSPKVPKIIITDPSESDNVVIPDVILQHEDSDMIKFSTSSVIDNLESNEFRPELSSLLANSESSSSNDTESQTSSDTFRPQISSLLGQSSDLGSNLNIPNISGLSLSGDTSTNNTNSTENSTEIGVCLPAFTQLIDNPDSKPVSSSRSCSSPLPNLSLNTLLPHFTYTELENATNIFDATPLSENGRFLGSGAFGEVYLAMGLPFSKPVAVKKLLLDNEQQVNIDDAVTKQFRNEVEVLSKYKHENLLSLLGYSCDGCTYCLLYEYIPGGALKDRLQKHELIWTERLYIAMGTAKAIAYLHTAYSTPLIHRDVKSTNILLDYSNKPKLCDFGLIKLSPSQNTKTGTTIVGTLAYMAPEALRGNISTKMDTFSFGVVLLELLTSLVPEGLDLVSHVEDNCEGGDITPLIDTSVGNWKVKDVNFGQKLYEIANKCLEERKQKRPDMTDVSKELDELVRKSL